MTLVGGHELATAVATTAALLAVLTGEQMNPIAWLTLLFVPAGWVMQLRRVTLPTLVGGVLALSAVAFGVLFTAREGLPSILLGAGYALCMLVCVRLLNRVTPAHDLQLYALSLLLVLDAAALNVSWAYAPCFLAYTVAIVWALTTRELKRAAQSDHEARLGKGQAPLWHERGLLRGRFFVATAAIAIVVLLATLSLFVLFPRVGLGMLRMALQRRTSGFATSVTLGTGGLISQDTTVVMRIRAPNGDEMDTGLYFRGAAFDRYDGASWSRSEFRTGELGSEAAMMPRPTGDRTRYRVSLEPLHVPYLFTAGSVGRVVVEPGPRVFAAPPVPARDGMGDLQLPSAPDEVVHYEVEADLEPLATRELVGAGLEYPESVTENFLSTEGVPGEVLALARQWAGTQTDPVAKVVAIAAELQKFKYTLEDQGAPFGANPLLHFLTVSQAGHCEYFATALAVMARAVGVPARMVGGYQGGALHPTDGYLVLRQSDAHAWVEIYVPDRGWVGVDATPAAALLRPGLTLAAYLAETLQRLWEQYVVDYDLGQQIKAAQTVANTLSRLRNFQVGESGNLSNTARPVLGVVVATALLAALLWLMVRRARVRRHPGHRLYAALAQTAERVAGKAPRTLTVREWLSHAPRPLSVEELQAWNAARDAYELCRFGGSPLDAREEARLMAALENVGRRGESSEARRAA
ncbi:MAG: transglutaminaseTgpA domain-containing protein [Myxococcota bacterium]